MYLNKYNMHESRSTDREIRGERKDEESMEWRKKLSTMTGVFLALLTLGLIWTGQMEVMAA